MLNEKISQLVLKSKIHLLPFGTRVADCISFNYSIHFRHKDHEALTISHEIYIITLIGLGYTFSSSQIQCFNLRKQLILFLIKIIKQKTWITSMIIKLLILNTFRNISSSSLRSTRGLKITNIRWCLLISGNIFLTI